MKSYMDSDVDMDMYVFTLRGDSVLIGGYDGSLRVFGLTSGNYSIHKYIVA